MSLSDFQYLYDRDLLNIECSGEWSLDPAEFRGPDDALSAGYRTAVLDGWRSITTRDVYDPVESESFEVELAEHLPRPFPFTTRDQRQVAHYLGAVAAAIGRLPSAPPARVVEYGAGWGHLALACASTGFQTTAVDINAASVDLLRTRAAKLDVPLDVVRASFLDYEPDDLVDAILFFESFHHCDDPWLLLDRCVSSLRPGGRLLFVADAIYEGFHAPWGVRLDGQAAYMARRFGWLELGFEREFFLAQLERRGLVVETGYSDYLGPYGAYISADLP